MVDAVMLDIVDGLKDCLLFLFTKIVLFVFMTPSLGDLGTVAAFFVTFGTPN